MGATAKSGGLGANRPRPIARRTGRPAKHTPNAVAQARRLTESETLDQLRLSPDDIDFLDRCAAGHPPRNAQAAIGAIKLKLDFTTRKPKQEIEVVETTSTADITDAEWERLARLEHEVRRG